MAIKYHVKAAVSEYEDKTEGKIKKRYQTIGIVMETQKGDLMIKIESMPMLAMKEGALWAYLNDPEDKPASTPSTIKEDIPF